MHFVIHCVDRPDSGNLRAANRQAHLDFLARHAERIVSAGPILTEDGSAMIGSVLILEFDDRADAEAFADDDPYAKAGVFETVTILPWRKVYPKD